MLLYDYNVCALNKSILQALHYVIKNQILIPNCFPPSQNLIIGYVLDNGKVIVHTKYEVLTRRKTVNTADIRNYQQLFDIFIYW